MTTPGPILVGSTVVAHKLDGTELKWLTHAEELRSSYAPGVDFFLAVEVDARGLGPFTDILERVRELEGDVWTFGIDKQPFSGLPFKIYTGERFVRIATGRNLIAEYARERPYTHVLFLDTDTEPPPDALPKLVEVDRPVAFGHVPTYCLDGPRISKLPGDTRAHWSSAGFVLVQKRVLRYVSWGWDPDEGMSDDPRFARDAELIGRAFHEDWSPVTRHDCVGTHYPQSIVPLEYRGTDTRLFKQPPEMPQMWCLRDRNGDCGWCAQTCDQLVIRAAGGST